MTRDEAFDHLPTVHRQILAWIAAGDDHDAIAARLDIDRAAVAPLVVVAHKKLDRLVDQNEGDPHA